MSNGYRSDRKQGNAALAVLTMFTLAACGGGGSDPEGMVTPPPLGSATPPPAPGSSSSPTGYTAGVYSPSASFKNQCASPRSGSSAVTGIRFPDTAGSVTAENNFLRSWTNELYLWYREVPDLNPATYSTAEYFELLKTDALTASGAEKDRFHFSMSTAEWEAFSQEGTSAGYGAQFYIVQATPPRKVVIAFTEPNSPAATAGLQRGDEIVSIDGVNVVNADTQADVNTLNAGLSPAAAGQAHSFVLLRNGNARSVQMTSANVTSTPVQNTHVIGTVSGNVGYLLFNDHIATAESQLIAAVTSLKSQDIVDLVIDMRYNGGGYLDIASEFAYMIAGSSRTSGQTFERIAFNDKHPTTDPVTGESLAPTPFHTRTQGFSTIAGGTLPTLDLQKVYVLTTAATCSASEAIINGLRGVDVQVIQIGDTTCGKPYGFYPQDNCSTTYFSVQFKGVNAKDFGDYPDGFSPQNTSSSAGVSVEGCSVADDFAHQLGDTDEPMLAAALDYRISSSCPTPSGMGSASGFSKPTAAAPIAKGRLLRPEWRENRMMRTVE